MDDKLTQVDSRQVEVINTGEELLIKARGIARQIDERVWRAMDGHALPPPRGTAATAGDGSVPADQ